MAKPIVFISSTYYDLKHLRSALEEFVDSLGFEPVLSEKGDIAYSPDVPLDESCNREAMNADIFVLIIGGRYGSEASSGEKKPDKGFFDRYDSVTKKEYMNAISNNVPIYVLIDINVHAEYFTFLNNKNNKDIKYAHVDSVNVFYLIKDIYLQPSNNPIRKFDEDSEIKDWLRKQWAGLFRELLWQRSQQQRITSFDELLIKFKENIKYMEAIISKISPDESKDIVNEEEESLRKMQELRENMFVKFLLNCMDFEDIRSAIEEATDFNDFATRISKNMETNVIINYPFKENSNEIDDARSILGKAKFDNIQDFIIYRDRVTPRPLAKN